MDVFEKRGRCTRTWSEKREREIRGWFSFQKTQRGHTDREVFSGWLLSSTGSAAGPPRDWPAVDGRFRYVELRSTAVRKGRARRSSDLLREAEADEEDLQERWNRLFPFIERRPQPSYEPSQVFEGPACPYTQDLKATLSEKNFRYFQTTAVNDSSVFRKVRSHWSINVLNRTFKI